MLESGSATDEQLKDAFNELNAAVKGLLENPADKPGTGDKPATGDKPGTGGGLAQTGDPAGIAAVIAMGGAAAIAAARRRRR